MSDTYVWKAYQYIPSKWASILFATLFGIATAYSLYQFFSALRQLTDKKDKRQICSLIPFIVGGVFETVGYCARVWSHSEPDALSPFIAQSLLLLVAPALFAASIYMVLGRIIGNLECGPFSIIPLKWLTKLFVLGDVISFLVQGSGGGLMASKTITMVNVGEKLIIVGLILQIMFFGMFIVVMAIFQKRVKSRPTAVAVTTRHVPSKFRNWQMILLALFSSSALIFVRSIVRVVEFAQGNDGYLISHEVYLYVFDAVLMVLAMGVFLSQDIGGFYATFSRISQLELQHLDAGSYEKSRV